MKLSLLLLLLTVSFISHGQAGHVTSLPTGTYGIQNSAAAKFTFGDIVLLDDSHYRLSSDGTTGDYKFSATAQRLLFVSGALKGAFARTVLNADGPAILIPLKENEELGIRLATADVVAINRRK
jgi:hypothetical protein